jgi:Circadian oscillating protein COP23
MSPQLSPQFLKKPQVWRSLATKGVSLATSMVLLVLSGTALAASGSSNGLQPSPLKQSQPQTPDTPSPTDSNTRFDCRVLNNQYTVVYYPESQPNQAYPWAVPSQLGGGWTPQLRCAEISRRLESYRPDGLQELSTGVENGYNVICATTQRDPACRIVLTVPPGQDPVATRDRVFENLAVADSGQQTEGVAAFQGDDSRDLLGRIGDALNLDLPSLSGRRNANRNGINLRPFLDPADGGTGERLQDGIPARSGGTSLNPDRFR